MPGTAQPQPGLPDDMAYVPLVDNGDAIAGTDRSSTDGPGAAGVPSNERRTLDAMELDAALQLLVERAQYITGATGTALALPDAEDMVCRASAGSSAPGVGARLQVRSGLTAESISRRQLLRCDNAETDPRVNLEACRALGIASIVVLPLLRRNGEVRGLFELFSDHPYAFEERDLIALERMADLTITALDLAEQHENSRTVPTPEPETAAVSSTAVSLTAEPPTAGLSTPAPLSAQISTAAPSTGESLAVESSTADSAQSMPAILVSSEFAEERPTESRAILPAPVVISDPIPILAPAPATVSAAAPAALPEAMLRVQKCASCGFPVSEGRTLCLDCEKKEYEKKDLEKKAAERKDAAPGQDQTTVAEHKEDAPPDSAPLVQQEEEFVPAFLANSGSVPESWLANHVNLLAIVVLILGILVAVVVFR